MIKCEVCGRTINEIVEQDGCVSIQSDMPFICDRCQQKEQFDKQVEILRKAMDYDKIKQQLNQQKEMWNKLKEFLIKGIKFDKEEIEENKEIPNLPNRHYLTIENIIIDKMQELEGEKDVKD